MSTPTLDHWLSALLSQQQWYLTSHPLASEIDSNRHTLILTVPIVSERATWLAYRDRRWSNHSSLLRTVTVGCLFCAIAFFANKSAS